MTKDERNIILEELCKHPVMVTSGALDVFNLIYIDCLNRGVNISSISFGDMCDVIGDDVMARTEE